MVFSSLVFLFFFLPLVLFIYFISPWKIKNSILLIVSLIFYAWGEPIYIGLMVFSAIVDYFHGRFIAKYRHKTPWIARSALFSSIIINLALLSFFKYADFLIDNMNLLLHTNMANLELALPIGLSFYTFQTMSYTIDVYRGKVEAQKNPFTLALYVCLFPQLIAGPIVRYELIEKELTNRTITWDSFSDGVVKFTFGLGKKVLIANNIGLLWNAIHSESIADISFFSAWLGILAFGFQIYYDFSGYSDMAIGLGRIFGFSFPENFNYPFISKSITEFWRRWHMTLGGWFRDYVYIPLGGSRVGKWKLYRNLFIVWGLTGLWHGASWNFVMWGLYFGIIITLEKAWIIAFLKNKPAFVSHLYFNFLIALSWPLFFFEDLSLGIKYIKILIGLSGNALIDTNFLYLITTNGVIFLLAIAFSIPWFQFIRQKCSHEINRWIDKVIIPVTCTIILILATAYLVNDSYNPFLYFRF